MIRPVPWEVIPLVKQFEGLVTKASPDPSGYPTIGYGHKIVAADPPSFRTEIMTEAEAEVLLLHDLGTIGAGPLCDAIHPSVLQDLTTGQYGALVDFVYNEGIKRYLRSTLCSFVNGGELDKVTDQFGLWVDGSVDGRERVLPGLVKRREAEKQMWLS